MGFADVLRSKGKASGHLFPRAREDTESGALTWVSWCPLECWSLCPRICPLRKLKGGTGEHTHARP